MNEPKVKTGDIVKDYNGHEYKVLKVSNVYSEVLEYDSNGTCQQYSTDEQLIELDLDPENILYCAVEKEFSQTALPNKYIRTFVFLISRDSKILGE